MITVLRYPDTPEARLAVAEAAREARLLCQKALQSGSPQPVLQELVRRVDQLLDLCSQPVTHSDRCRQR